MAPRVDLKQGEMKKHVARALKSLRDGYVIVAPLEHGYVYLADAFSPFAVRAMHVLRGDALGVAAQVLISDHSQIEGLARDISEDARALMKAFWPGALSLTLRPQCGLNWDLGDAGKLDWVSIRMPRHEFLQGLIKETGPLAVASAAMAGHPPIVEISQLNLQGHEVALIIDSGVIAAVARSSHVEVELTQTRLVREGAISQSEIAKVIPALVIP